MKNNYFNPIFGICLFAFFFLSFNKIYGQCKELGIADYELLCGYSQSEIKNFALKNGFQMKPYNGGVGFYCDNNLYFGLTKDGHAIFSKKSATFKNNFIKNITARGYSFRKTDDNSVDAYENDKFLALIYPEENNQGKYSFIIQSTNNNDESTNEKVYAKKLSNNNLLVDSYTNVTDISVKKGDKINITASGEIVVGDWAGSSSPDGIAGYESYSCQRDFKHGSLLVKIGNGEWQKAGSSKSFVAQTNGVLQFSVNDCDRDNNSGAFTVLYHVSRAK